ncbi:MAG TPA: phage holin family protein [Gemmataceae bacterium]|jgi:hypothetical protein|nr:phage holin family protein [Gemmataceae bacterium]
MANELQTPSPSEPNVTALVTGIINDAQELFKQQLALVRAEIKSDLEKTKDAARSLAIGAAVAMLAVVLLSLMLVHLLHWATALPSGEPRLPLWVCYLLVGGIFAGVGGALVVAGVRKLESFNPLPDQSVEALRENLQWRTTNTTKPTSPR